MRHCGAPFWIHWRITSIVDCGRYGPNCGMRSPSVCVPSSFWMMKLPSGFPGITRMRFGSRGLATLMRFPALNPGSSLRPYCTVPPPWQPGMAQLTEKTLAWMEASVGASGAGPPPATSGCPFWSSPSPVPAPQAPRTSAKAGIQRRGSKGARETNRTLLSRYLPANLAARAATSRRRAEEIGAVDVEVRIPREHSRAGRVSQLGPWSRNGTPPEGRFHEQLYDVRGPGDAGCARVNVRVGRVCDVVRHVDDQDFMGGRRVKHDGSLPGRCRCARISFLGGVQIGKRGGDSALDVELPADFAAAIRHGVDIEVEVAREQVRILCRREFRTGRNGSGGVVAGDRQANDVGGPVDAPRPSMDVRGARIAGQAGKGDAAGDVPCAVDVHSRSDHDRAPADARYCWKSFLGPIQRRRAHHGRRRGRAARPSAAATAGRDTDQDSGRHQTYQDVTDVRHMHLPS